MPEGPVVKTWAHRLRAKRTPREVHGRFILYPRCFKTANDYETCTVQREADYDSSSNCPVDVRDEHTFPSQTDRLRSKDQPWEYLLDSHLPGPLHIGVRGSILAVAAGHHLWLVDFMTDGNVMSVSTADYRAIAARSQDITGADGEENDPEQPRSFAIPDQYKDPQSARPEALRRLNILFALECSDDTVWLFVDHTRLIRFHVVSRGVPWTAADLSPESQIWTYAWAHSYGPDWFAADDDVLIPLLDQWRDNLIVDVTLGHYSTVPIADAIADDTVYFNGFGEHTASDLLHEAGILPHMPLWVVATDNYIFGQLRQRITVYSAAFKDPHFVKACGQGSSDPNPFFFNEHADNNYITQYVRVYQREVTCLSGSLYNVLAAQGLFDTEHTIWSPYLHQASNLTDKKKRMVPVWVCWRNGTNAPSQRRYYTIIQARPPPEWGLDDWSMAKASDHALLGGVQRSLGPMQFPQYILNMISIENLLGKGTMGRRPKKVSGKRGRPQKAKTVKQKKALAKRRISDINSETSLSMDLSSDMDADEPSIDAQGSSPSSMRS